MASNLIVKGHGQICRFKFGFGSYVKILMWLGLWFGIAGAAFTSFALLNSAAHQPSYNDIVILTAVMLLLLTVITIAIFLVFAIVSYPLYRWFSARIYFGEFELLENAPH